jgi:hypothetical protein
MSQAYNRTAKSIIGLVVAVPNALVPATPVTDTFASPSTSTETEPKSRN